MPLTQCDQMWCDAKGYFHMWKVTEFITAPVSNFASFEEMRWSPSCPKQHQLITKRKRWETWNWVWSLLCPLPLSVHAQPYNRPNFFFFALYNPLCSCARPHHQWYWSHCKILWKYTDLELSLRYVMWQCRSTGLSPCYSAPCWKHSLIIRQTEAF